MAEESVTDTTIHFKVAPEDKGWHERRAMQSGLKLSDYMRNLLLEKRLSVELAPVEPEPGEELPLRERYLQDIREQGAPISAAHRMGISQATLSEWGADPDFPKEVALARAAWLESLERDMALIGRGRIKGETQALGWLLNAYSPNHGRAKKELILGILNPLLKRLTEFIKAEFGPDSHERLKKAMERFQVEVRKKLVNMG